jgi:hypothetical protein
MTQLPDPNNSYHPPLPLPYAQGGFGPPKLRPTSVTVLAIIGIIMGSLKLLGSLCNGLQFAGVSINGNNPILKGVQSDHLLFAWSIFGLILNCILGVLLLFGSIWSLSLKRSGRSWLVLYSRMDIAFTLIGVGVSVAMVFPRMRVIVQHANMNATAQMSMQITLWVTLVLSLVFLAYPGLVLYYMSRPHVKEAFERGMVAPNPQWGAANPGAPFLPQQGGQYPPPPGDPGTY